MTLYDAFKTYQHDPDMLFKIIIETPRWYTVAVDFDGTLCINDFPDIGKAYDEMIRRVKYLQYLGVHTILWTCREGESLEKAKMWCAEHGLNFTTVNANTPLKIHLYGNDSRKIGYDEIWDDKAVYLTEVVHDD